MKNLIALILLLGISIFHTHAQRNCGYALMIQALEQKNPGTIQKRKALRLQQAQAFATHKTQQLSQHYFKLSETPQIPVVFHFVIDSSTFKNLGGIIGIEDRIQTQLESINADFNAANADSVYIPAVWKPLYANIGLRFALAKINPDQQIFPGYTLKIVNPGTRFNAIDGAKDMKYSSTGTLAFDNTKYLNIWVGPLSYGSSNILGITVPPNDPDFPKEEVGIALNQYAFGVRNKVGMIFINHIDKGRTLTHELGHFFGLYHTWGDDGGLCVSSGGDDDGIDDTPEEANAVYGNPSFPLFDACSPSMSGVMFMNYMDYTNDSSMQLFTKNQASVIQQQIALGGRSYSLTQNNYLLDTNSVQNEITIAIVPNPSQGIIKINYNPLKEPIQYINVYNLLGQEMLSINNPSHSTLDLSNFAKGMYMIKVQFQSKTIIEKIILN